MISTSTPALDLTEKKLKETTEDQTLVPIAIGIASPSARTIEAILNYSKNLEIKKSKLVQEIEYIKS